MKNKNAFSQGKESWDSTLKTISQNKTTKVTSSQSKKNNRYMSGEELLTKAMKKK